jgi:carnitine-CoA ligase
MNLVEGPSTSRTLPRLLERRAERDADGVLMADQEGELSAGETYVLAGRVADGFHRLGVRRGDRVALMLENSRDFVAAWFGLATLGAAQVPVNPQAVGDHLAFVLRHSGASALVIDDVLLPGVAPALAALVRERALAHVIVRGDRPHGLDLPVVPFAELLSGTPRFDGVAATSAADTMAIMYTSGSTGAPKGVVMPFGQHCENGRQATAAAGIGPEDRLFVCLPLHHNMAQGYGVMPALVAGASFHLAPRFQRSTFWDEVRASRSTVWPFIGAMLVLLAQQEGEQPNPLRVAYGVPIPPEVHPRFEQRFAVRLIPCYGSTEATIVTWGTIEGGDPPGSCGRVLPQFDVQIQQPDGTPAPDGASGEICIRPREPAIMFQGYHDEPERGRLAVRDLWFHSGDQGRLDSGGWLWFGGRGEDVIRRFGEFISASEVEDVVLSCPSVDLVAAYGVPDEVAGEELMVAVAAREDSGLRAEDVREWCRGRLPQFAVPRYVDVVEELPMTATGKIQKYVLRGRGIAPTTYDGRHHQAGG